MPYTSGQTTYAFCSLLLFRSFFTNSPLARSRFKERFFIDFFVSKGKKDFVAFHNVAVSCAPEIDVIDKVQYSERLE